MWFDYEGDTILVNCAAHRTKTGWIRNEPAADQPARQPGQPVSLGEHQAHRRREISEDDPREGPRVTAQLDKIWTKYTQQPGPYGLRDPSIDERRVLFECTVDQIATFGKP